MGVRMTEFLMFVAKLGTELYDLWQHAKAGHSDPELEKKIAMRIIRKAMDAEAKEEIEGA